MTTPFIPEAEVRAWFAARDSDTRYTTALPAKLASSLPLVRVTRIGGFDEFTGILDTAELVFDAFAADIVSARELAYGVWYTAREELIGQDLPGAHVSAMQTFTPPHQNTYPDNGVFWFSLALQFTFRRQP